MLNYIIRQADIYLKSKSREVIKMLKRLAKELCIYILAGWSYGSALSPYQGARS